MSEPEPKLLAPFNSVLAEGVNLRFMARDTTLQTEQIERLRSVDAEAEALKNARIVAGDEKAANSLLAVQCLADCQAEEMQMWLKLKVGRTEEAWNHLVLAQEAFAAACRTKVGFSHLAQEQTRLILLEEIIFPPQIYFSLGFLVRGLTCAICNADYETCDHIAGQPYWGQFCATIPKTIEPDHSAIVDAPADKRCRIAFVSDAGRKRNRMTWALTDESMEDRTIQGILIAATGRWARMVFTLEMLQGHPTAILGKPIYG